MAWPIHVNCEFPTVPLPKLVLSLPMDQDGGC